MVRAESILKALDDGEFEQARVDFDATMQANLSAEQLSGVWASLPQQVGARVGVAAGRTQAAGGATVAIIPLQHAKAWLELQVSCNAGKEKSVAYMCVRVCAPTAAVPTVEESALWSERELTVESAGLSLPTTLTVPKDEVRAGVVLVPGSGAHERDESIGPNRVFRDLAHGLAERGIAVLRYEKRSHAHPQSTALLAEWIHLPGIVGTFLAGLAVNASVKDKPAKGKLEFLGSSLFVPIFFLVTGFLIDPIAVVRSISQDFLLASGLLGALVAGKWIAAEACGRAFGYPRAARRTVWSLTLPQVAATLAATLVAHKTVNTTGQPLLDSRMLNAVLIVVLVTAILGPVLTQHYAPRMLEELPQPASGD